VVASFEDSVILQQYKNALLVVRQPDNARLIPDKPYRNPEKFLAAMSSARVTVLECRALRG
jgi:hypothetical protein